MVEPRTGNEGRELDQSQPKYGKQSRSRFGHKCGQEDIEDNSEFGAALSSRRRGEKERVLQGRDQRSLDGSTRVTPDWVTTDLAGRP